MSGICENLQLLCAVCKIGAYSLFCRLCCKGPPLPKPDFPVVCLGLGESGKTSILMALCQEKLENIEPTRGFIIKAVQLNNCILSIKEIGGGEKVRPFWKHYYRGAMGVVFVVDSAAPYDEMEEAKGALAEVLSDPTLSKLPCLILANCQDKPDARNEQQVKSDLDLNTVCGDRPWALHLCQLSDVEGIRDGFAKLTVHLFAPEKEEDRPRLPNNRI